MPRPLSVTVSAAVLVELDLDKVGVAGDRLVHGVVDDLGEEVMQRLLVGAADIHAGPAADRLQPLQHLDVGGGVARLSGAGWRAGGACGTRAAPEACGGAGFGEEIVVTVH